MKDLPPKSKNGVHKSVMHDSESREFLFRFFVTGTDRLIEERML